ncbi:MAG: hypothetical protein LV480_11015 [Methylacidiphilales bacterium]|nr:hypothetical protein [Candidatus Methylacidiphilales bacterium]
MRPGTPGRVEQAVGSLDVRFDEPAGIVDGAVDKRFRREVDDRGNFVLSKDLFHERGIRDVAFYKAVKGMFPDRIEVHHGAELQAFPLGPGVVGKQPPDQGRPMKPVPPVMSKSMMLLPGISFFGQNEAGISTASNSLHKF